MPWNESSVMDQRLRCVARLLDGEQMSLVCREFGISRKTYCSGGGRLPKSLYFADSDVTIGVNEGEKCPRSRLGTSLRLGGGVTGRGGMR
jgi:hypothetical protein